MARELAPVSRRFSTVAVHSDPKDALEDWSSLAAAATVTPYQRPGWVLPWIGAVGLPAGITPMIVVARDAGGLPVAVLPLGIERQGGLTTASFLGAKDSNFNMGVFRPGVTWTRAASEDLLRRAAESAGRRIDLFTLRNQPHGWQGVLNPLLALARQPSPSFAYKATLGADPEAFFHQRLSRENRKKLRQKMNRLRGMGTVDVIEARDAAEAAGVLDAFAAQRTARNAASGLPADDLPALRSFLDRTVGGTGPISFFALRCDDRIVATLGGIRSGDRFSAMVMSFTADPDFARTSPGELLLAEVMRRCCEEGLSTFDLGIGEARYKETYCPEVEELFDSLVPVTAVGRLYARAESIRLLVKRSIKQSPRAWRLVQRLRRMRARAGGRV